MDSLFFPDYATATFLHSLTSSMSKSIIAIAMLAVGTGAQPTPVAKLLPCDPSSVEQIFEYTEMAFVQHAASGLTLVALGDTNSSTEVAFVNEPTLVSAQWMYHTDDHTLHAFRDSGRCLTTMAMAPAVASCDTSDTK